MQAPHTLATNHNGSDWLARIYREPLSRAFRALSVVEQADKLLDHFDTQHIMGERLPIEMIHVVSRPPFFVYGKLTSHHSSHDGGSVNCLPSGIYLIWHRWHEAPTPAHFVVTTPSFGNLPAVIDDFGDLVCVHGARELTCGE